MDINSEREIGRRLRDMAKSLGLDMMPDGFRLIVNLDGETDEAVVHAIFVAKSETVEAAIAAPDVDPQVAEDARLLAEMEREMARHEREAAAEELKRQLIEDLKSDGDFL